MPLSSVVSPRDTRVERPQPDASHPVYGHRVETNGGFPQGEPAEAVPASQSASEKNREFFQTITLTPFRRSTRDWSGLVLNGENIVVVEMQLRFAKPQRVERSTPLPTKVPSVRRHGSWYTPRTFSVSWGGKTI